MLTVTWMVWLGAGIRAKVAGFATRPCAGVEHKTGEGAASPRLSSSDAHVSPYAFDEFEVFGCSFTEWEHVDMWEWFAFHWFQGG